MEIFETVTLMLPDVRRELASFGEAAFAESHGLVVDVAAIHAGSTANHNFYGEDQLRKSVKTWTTPYQKPLLRHHDPYSEAIGRIIGSRMATEADGSPFIRLQVAVTDPEAIEKVGDERYLTGSVGGKAGKALCSICKADWANASWFDLPCEHQRGKKYGKQVAELLIEDITWKEYSFVNMPADGRSGVMSTDSAESARLFCLDLARENVIDLSRPNANLLESFRGSEATVLYEGLRDAFFAAVEATKADADKKESTMGESPEETTASDEGDDDVLAAVEGLVTDPPAAAEADSEEPGDEPEPAEEPAAEEPAAEEPSADEPPADEPEEPAEEPAAAADGDADGDADDAGEPEPEPASADADAGDEDGDGEADVAPPVEEEAPAGEPANPAREAQLLAENTRLRAALKRNLAERVVDTKIGLGLCEADDRDDEITSHLARSASSLADTLRDLASMPATRHPLDGLPKVQSTQAALEGDPEREIAAEVVETAPSPKTPEDPAENLLVDVFMGRRSL